MILKLAVEVFEYIKVDDYVDVDGDVDETIQHHVTNALRPLQSPAA